MPCSTDENGKWIIPEWKMEIIARSMTNPDLTQEELAKIEVEYENKMTDIHEEFNKAFGIGKHGAYEGWEYKQDE